MNWEMPEIVDPIIIPKEIVREVISQGNDGTSPDLLQRRREHARDLISAKGGIHFSEIYLSKYTKYLNIIVCGNKLPKECHQFLAACTQIPIPKGVVDARPIAIPNEDRKCLEQCIVKLKAQEIAYHFKGSQYGVFSPNRTGKNSAFHQAGTAKQAEY